MEYARRNTSSYSSISSWSSTLSSHVRAWPWGNEHVVFLLHIEIFINLFDVKVDPALTAPAMEWCEYRSPEGKPYYFNLKTSQSVWEKPQVLKDYDGKVSFSWSNFLNLLTFFCKKTKKKHLSWSIGCCCSSTRWISTFETRNRSCWR